MTSFGDAQGSVKITLACSKVLLLINCLMVTQKATDILFL